ncbi:hypothetical protein CHUAL_003226 [Chamberlinius hualienensis]
MRDANLMKNPSVEVVGSRRSKENIDISLGLILLLCESLDVGRKKRISAESGLWIIDPSDEACRKYERMGSDEQWGREEYPIVIALVFICTVYIAIFS